MPTPEQIRIFNEAVSLLEETETAYQAALQDYRSSDNHDSQAVDRALALREVAKLGLQCAELALSFDK